MRQIRTVLAGACAGLLLASLVIADTSSRRAAEPRIDSLEAPRRSSDVEPTSGAPYSLDESSTYITGCFPAPPFGCAGPIRLFPSFTGGFNLMSTGTNEDGFEVFVMTNVQLTATAGTDVREIVGTGIYLRSEGEDAQHSMVLTVLMNGAPVVFDSGVLPVPDGTAFIDIAVDMNDLINYDTQMRIVADANDAATATDRPVRRRAASRLTR